MSATLNNNDDEGWRHRLQLYGVEGLNDLDRWRMRRAEQSGQRAQRTQQHSGTTSEEVARARDEITGLRTELDGLRSDVITGLKAVGDGFDHRLRVRTHGRARGPGTLATERRVSTAQRTSRGP